jgi:hypothetical protein
MEIVQTDVSLRPEQDRKAADLKFKKQLEDRLNELKADVSERPFLCLAIAFIAGFVSHTFPGRILYLVLLRLVFWLLGAVILLMGVVKLSDLISGSQRNEATVLQGP